MRVKSLSGCVGERLGGLGGLGCLYVCLNATWLDAGRPEVTTEGSLDGRTNAGFAGLA